MESLSEDTYAELQKTNWILVSGCNPYLIKYKLHNAFIAVLMTDFREIYGVWLSDTDIQSQFDKENPSILMKTNVLIKKINQALKEFVENQVITKCSVVEHSENITLQLNLAINEDLKIRFDILLSVLPPEMFKTHVTIPAILAAICLEENFIKGQSNQRWISSGTNFHGNVFLDDLMKYYLNLQVYARDLESKIKLHPHSKHQVVGSCCSGVKEVREAIPISIDKQQEVSVGKIENERCIEATSEGNSYTGVSIPSDMIKEEKRENVPKKKPKVMKF